MRADPPTPAPAALLVDEPTAAEILCCSARWLYELRRAGALPFVRLGKRGGVRYAVVDLERFIADRRQGGAP